MKYTLMAQSKKTKARAGVITTNRGEIKTPVFMPVGTLASVKAMMPEDLKLCGVEIILGNTYHLYLRPGTSVIELFSGLHNFMNWDKPILTDSGGYQIFSLAKLSKLTEEGYSFRSHIDGSLHMLTPEKSIQIQLVLNSDIMMCLDKCIGYSANKKDVEEAAELTERRAKRSKQVWDAEGRRNSLFGIVQGGMYKDLRIKSAESNNKYNFPGYAKGG